MMSCLDHKQFALLLDVHRSTLLHTAAMYNRSDCIPLLLADGINITAIDSQGRSALQLACLYSDCNTVTLLFDEGGWLDDLAAACMLNATISGNCDTLALLIERGISCSGVIDDSELTLIHAAAAFGRLECLGLLMRQGYDAHAISSEGLSAVNIACTDNDVEVLVRDSVKRPAWSERQATAKMLLQHGVSCNSSSNSNDDHAAAILAQYVDWLREQTTQQHKLLQAHVAGTYTMNDMNNDIESANHVVKLQLLNADTGVKSAAVYTVNITVLQKLHAILVQTVSTSILSNMLLPAEQWATTYAAMNTDNVDNCDMIASDLSATTMISYNGECTTVISYYAMFRSIC
jgi:ankyrin repeat protein